jgi:hypothetical protein
MGMQGVGEHHHRLSDRTFGLVFAVLLLLIFAIGWLLFDRIHVWALIVSGCFGLIALVAPSVLMPVNRLWMLVAGRLNHLMNLILLIVSYVLAIVPFGLFMKLRRRDALRLKMSPEETTYWVPPVRKITREHFRDMF